MSIKVSKKDERLARALHTIDLIYIGFPYEEITEKVNTCWPGLLNKAKEINKIINSIENYELASMTWQSEIDKYED